MKVINETHWRTDHLKAILERVAKESFEGRPRKKAAVVVTVSYSNQSNHTGHAWLGGTKCVIRIPRTKEQVCLDHFAHTADHEFAHLRGKDHREMSLPEMYFAHWKHEVCERVNGPKFQWANSMPLEPKLTPSKQVADPQQIRYQQTLEALKRWEDKLPLLEKEYQSQVKRTKTMLRKLKERKYYYEKEVFAKRPQPQ